MRLDEWRKQNSVTATEFARRLNRALGDGMVTYNAVWRWETGRSMPSAPKISAIEKLTEGRVTASDFANHKI